MVRNGGGGLLGARRYATADVSRRVLRFPPAVTAKPGKLKRHGRNTVKPVDSRKTFLVDLYKYLMESQKMVILLHYNNLTKVEDHSFRYRVGSINQGKFYQIRNNLFQVYLKNSRRQDPCAPLTLKDKSLLQWNHPLLPLLCGPTAIVTFKETDPTAIAKLVKLLATMGDKLLMIGGQIDGEVMTNAQLLQFSKLPSMPQMQAQLVNHLQLLAGGHLTQTLEANYRNLYLTLKSHSDNISKE
ncbi:hypothetical protein KAFR_0H01680 [Kazachstania africana CBS 2517]|uniref:Ribosomal protein L10 n=1 Tax=Kazachstania africana (strain ATCC 22294 / BCRC 22015 / CBS 2517 / CECT 1963 / NBRC 1671 / NRRL Y-8276) TaxID=1071382 RepID=H2AZ22_KAZAF|nr:hypothetical protein KAFR_0H01680 [Kazachstania africana CBS 2517]CCF59578.1 hypothetical protein KAFR_0H01680 [Kazachstania africana CBS 2517]